MFPPPFIPFHFDSFLLLLVFGLYTLLLMGLLPVSYLTTRKKQGTQHAKRYILVRAPIHLALWGIGLLVCNHYYSQLTTTLDPRGIHWSTFTSKHTLAWQDITELRIDQNPLTGKRFIARSSNQQYSIELRLLRFPDRFVNIIKSQTHLKISSDSRQN